MNIFLSALAYVLGGQKNHLIETFLLSIHNICFSRVIRKLIFNYALLSGGLVLITYAKYHSLNMHGSRGLKFALSLYLRFYFVSESSPSPGFIQASLMKI